MAGKSNNSADDVTIVGLEIEGDDSIHETVLRPGNSDALCVDIEQLYMTIADQWSRQGSGPAEMRLRVLLEESILNAWKHGNAQMPGSAVRVRWHTNNEFVLEVVDEGPGFDPEAIPDPRSDARRCAADGRGIFMIKKMCDFVRWKRGGSHMVASFARTPRRDSAAPEGLNCRLPKWHVSGGKAITTWT